jgi:hypothetical protein
VRVDRLLAAADQQAKQFRPTVIGAVWLVLGQAARGELTAP